MLTLKMRSVTLRIKSILSWIIILGGIAWVVKNQIVTIPAGVQNTVRSGIQQVAVGLDSIINSNWNFNQNEASAKSNAGAQTPIESIVKDKTLSSTYYYSFEAGTATEVQTVFKEAIETYNATGIVKLVPGAKKGWLNHITLGTYQKAMPEAQSKTLELGVGGPQIMEQQGIVSRIANQGSARLNVDYQKAISTSVALHELGHALGLDHSADPGSVMYPLDRGHTELSQADLNGLKQIYNAKK
jgi:hypothetical protein